MKKFITSLFLGLGLALALSASAAPTAPPTPGLNSFGAAVSNPFLTKDQAPLEFIQLRGESNPNVKAFGFTRNAAGVVRSMPAASESRNVRDNAGEEASCTAYLNVDVEGFRYLKSYIYIFSDLVNKETGETYYFELPTEDWFFDAPMICEDVPAGEYAAYVVLDVMRNDYSDDGKEWETYVINYADITVAPDSKNLATVKMSDAIHTLEYRGVDNEGIPFPYFEEPENWDDYEEPEEHCFTSPYLDFEYWGYGCINFNNGRLLFMAPELDAKCRFGGHGTVYFKSSPIYYVFNMSKNGPFTGDLILNNDPADYKFYNARYNLTPKDLENSIHGAGFVNWALYMTPEGLAFDGAVGIGGAWGGRPFATTDLRVCWQEDDANVFLNGWSPQTRVQWDPDASAGEMKVAGVYVPDADGNIIVTGPSYYKQNNGDYTLISPIDVFNINPDKTDIVNFRQTLFMSGKIDWYFLEDGSVLGIWPQVYPTGLYHEYVASDNRMDWYKNTRLNGEEIEFDSLYFKQLTDGDFVEFDLVYDNVMVEEKISTEALLTVGSKFGGPDFDTPYLTDFMVALEDGTPTCRVPIDEANGASLHLIAKDDYDSDFSICVELAEQDSDEWTEVNITPQKIAKQVDYISISLAEMAHDKWYKVRVTATDHSDNYCIATINYAFIVSNESGIGTVAADCATGCEPVYYNLQGARVTNPSSGLYIRVDGNKAEKVLLK